MNNMFTRINNLVGFYGRSKSAGIFYYFPVVIVASPCIWGFFRSKIYIIRLYRFYSEPLLVLVKLTHRFVDEIYSVGLGYTVTHERQNVLIWFFVSFHGVQLGAIFCMGRT